MDPLPFDSGSVLVQQHIDDLRREAALRRLVRSSRSPRGARRKAPGMRLQRAPAP